MQVKNKHFDVVIVGASIAGCTAATLFARQGLRVALVEQQKDPNFYKKICTHYIQANAIPTMERLGLLPFLKKAGANFGSIEFWTSWGWIRSNRCKEFDKKVQGLNIRRQVLDPILRQMTQATNGVTFFSGFRCIRLLKNSEKITGIEIQDSQGQKSTLVAELTVGADGRNSFVANIAHVPEVCHPHGRFACGTYFKSLSLPTGNRAQTWLLDPDIAYAFPTDNDITFLACFITKDKYDTWKQDFEKNFIRFFENLPDQPIDVRKAKRIHPYMKVNNLKLAYRKVYLPGLALIGDAALSSDPAVGVGIGWAFQSAEWLVRTCSESLKQKQSLNAALNQYARKHKKELKAHYQFIAKLANGRPLNRLEKLFLSAAAKDPLVAEVYCLINARITSPNSILQPKNVARILWVNAKAQLNAFLAPLWFKNVEKDKPEHLK